MRRVRKHNVLETLIELLLKYYLLLLVRINFSPDYNNMYYFRKRVFFRNLVLYNIAYYF